MGSAWSSDCYDDGMFGRGGVTCGGDPPSATSMGVCQRDPNFNPCAGPGVTCPVGANEGEPCGDVPGRGETVDCVFPLLCVEGTCAWRDPTCR